MGKMTSTPRRGLSRRGFLKHAGAGLAAAPLLPACSNSNVPASAPAGGDARVGADNPFQHGVASGDPMSDRVMFWTRVSTAADSLVVDLAVYSDPDLSLFVTGTRATASAARDYTVKLDVAGLEPGTTYYYRFSAAGFDSPIGRTRTAPLGGVDQLRFGVVSCSSYAHGYFNAYRHLAARADIDAILHLGDYIYEYGTNEYGNVRPYEPAHEMITLEDYRTRHAYYKQEPAAKEGDDPDYKVVKPPVGATVDALPKDAKQQTIDGTDYYEYAGTYYQVFHSGSNVIYRVVQNPQG